eukprot:1623572-Prymnesium_polylepis.1
MWSVHVTSFCLHPVSALQREAMRCTTLLLLLASTLAWHSPLSALRPGRATVARLVAESYFDDMDKDDVSAIKRRYRKLAATLHPDANRAPDAEDQFARLSLEYQALVEAKKVKLRQQELGLVILVVGAAAAGSRIADQDPLLPVLLTTLAGGLLAAILEGDVDDEDNGVCRITQAPADPVP